MYGEDHAVQISASGNAVVDTSLLEKVRTDLQQANVETKSVALEDGHILIRLYNNDDQLIAKETLEKVMTDDYVVALNLAPDTPEWLESLGGEPIKLGLDLRGGVHFLMEVDMNTAMARSFEQMVGDFRTALREEKLRYRTIKQLSDGVEIQFRDQEVLDKALFFPEESQPRFTVY